MVVDARCVCFFFKQKTAYEMRISDWSSDVCSSDLANRAHGRIEGREQLVLGVDMRAREAVEQGRFAGIRIADQRHHRIGNAPPRLAMEVARDRKSVV